MEHLAEALPYFFVFFLSLEVRSLAKRIEALEAR